MADGGQPFGQVQRLTLSFGPGRPRTDDLTGKYAARIADTSLSERAREGAVLFQVAEAHLEEEEASAALHAAEGVVGIFREVGDPDGAADALRLVTMAHHLRDRPDEASRVAREELIGFRSASHRRGEAAMLFSLAEADFRDHGPVESVGPAEDARGLFHQLGDLKMEGNVALALAEMHMAARSALEAQAAAKDALAVFTELADERGKARALDRLAHAHFVIDRDDAGLESLEDSLALLRGLDDSKGVAAAINARAETRLLRGDYRQAMLDAIDSLGISQRIGYARGHAASLAVIVHAHLGGGEGRKALRTATEGLERIRQAAVRDRRAEVMALNTLIHAYTTTGNPDAQPDVPREAFAAAEEALELCRELRDKKWVASALQTVARFHILADRFAEARELLEDALEACMDAGNTWGQALALYTLADVHLHEKGHKEALGSAREAASLFQQVGEKRGEAHVMMGMAALHCAAGEVEEAVVSLEEARALYVEMGDRRGEADALLHMAGVQLQGEDCDQEGALRHAEEGWELLRDLHDRRMLRDALQIVGNLHLTKGDSELALEVAEDALGVFQRLQDFVGRAHARRLEAQARLDIFVREEADLQWRVKLQSDSKQQASRMRIAEKRAQELYSVAVKAARAAVDAARACGEKRSLAGSLHLLGLTLGASRVEAACKEALQHALAASRLSHECGDCNLEAQALLAQADLRLLLGEQPSLLGAPSSLELGLGAARRAAEIFQDLRDGAGAAAAAAACERLLAAAGPQADAAAAPGAPGGQAGAAALLGGLDEPPQASQATADPPAAEAAAEMLGVVARLAKSAIGFPDEIDQDAALMDVGMDSLSAVSFRNGVQQSLGLKLPSTLVLDHPTLREVAAHLQELGGGGAG